MKFFLKSTFLILLCFLFLSNSNQTLAAEPTTDWVIRNFETTIELKDDGTALITEKIIADCGQLPDKHGIFRSISEGISTGDGFIEMPIKLVGITDFQNKKINFTTTKSGHVITWKIGDANKTVSEKNEYTIVYEIKNIINHQNKNQDEFYWNILGPEWTLPINNFSAKIVFPKNLEQSNVRLDSYYHTLQNNQKLTKEYFWQDKNTLIFQAKDLNPQQALTASIVFPKNIIQEYNFTFVEKYGQFFPYISTFLIFIICFIFWKKFGDDKKDSRSIIAQYEPPKELSLLELGAVVKNGHFQTKAITAQIFNLAVKGFIKIDAKDEKNFIFTKTEKPTENLNRFEKELLNKIFAKNNSFEFSKGYNSNLANIMKFPWSTEITKELTAKDILDKKANKAFWILLAVVAGIGFISYLLFKNIETEIHLIISLVISLLIFVFFAYFMKKLTTKGQDILWQTKGFQLYMNTAEKYREQFNEKENIFEKFLPYAMLFGLTKIWVNKMKQIYGEDYFNNYHPAWFIGANLGTTNFNQIESAISTISNNLNSAMTSSSGSGGGGFAGGGGGGGGGGGW